MIRVVLTGGSTGGHLYPLISVARELKKQTASQKVKLELAYVGAPPLEQRSLTEERIRIFTITSLKVRRYPSVENVFDLLKLPIALLQALWWLYLLMPEVVFSKGGPGTLPVVWSASFFRIPIVLHESDSIPGRTNLACAKAATRIAVSFAHALSYFPKHKTALLGQPIRRDLVESHFLPNEEYQLGLLRTEKKILILGGSQGSAVINDFVIDVLPELIRRGQVIHQCGREHFSDVELVTNSIIQREVPLQGSRYKLFDFLGEEEMFKFLHVVDLVISRAGSGAIFEIAATGKPSILVPLPEDVGGRHQIENAYEYGRTGAAVVIEQANLKPHLFMSVIDKILNDEELAVRMRQAAHEFAKPQAAQMIAQELLRFA